jgi:CRP-like cAMP-binding protein/ribonuclease BN (tRNA processing enzyme)
MARIVSLESGGGNLDGVTLSLEDGEFVFRENEQEIARLATRISHVAMPLTVAPPRPLQRQELTLQFIGGSDGFDPAGITTCFLAYLGTDVTSQAVLFDAAAYLLVRLGNLGISPSHVACVVLSHLHEDHVAGLPELILMGGHRVHLLTSDLIYASLLRVLSAMLAIPEHDVAAFFDHQPLNPGRPLDFDGHHFEAIYAIHSIPTIAVRVGGICYSGDMRYDEEWFAELENRAVLSSERRAELTSFAEGASVLVQDVGGGTIHSTITPALLESLTAKSQRLVLAHTSKHLLPTDSEALLGQIEFAGSGHVVGIGAAVPDDAMIEKVETIAACPLFARLPVAERVTLAQQTEDATWQDGQAILYEGESSDGCAYIVHSGLVEIWAGGEQMRVLGRGSSIGERGALLGDVRTSTMRARGPVHLLKLAPQTFAPVAAHLGLAEAFERADWLWTLPVLRDLPWASLLDLALEFQPRRLAEGETVFQIDEPGFEGYILVSGTLAFYNAENQQIDTIAEPGQFFGGRSALYGTPRNTSARALSASEVWAFPRSAFERLNVLYPNILLHLRTVEAGYSERERPRGS